MYHTASALYNELLGIYFDEITIYQMLDKSKMNPRYDLTNLKVIIMMNGIQENQIIHQ